MSWKSWNLLDELEAREGLEAPKAVGTERTESGFSFMTRPEPSQSSILEIVCRISGRHS